ncbi:MAG: nuclear transport factor 2 family protein [Candidatus Kapaibacterium sp.]
MTSVTSIVCEQLAQAQLDAYNAHDVDAFAAVYSDDVQLIDLASGSMFCIGVDGLRDLYARKFAEKPTMHCRLVNRIVCPPFVIDEEDVAGLVDGKSVHAVATYECRDGKICRAWFLHEVLL